MYKTQAEAVKDWLQAYRNEEKRIDEDLERLRELRARIMSIGAQEISDMPRAPAKIKDSLAEYIIRAEDLERRLSQRSIMHERDRAAILDLISSLSRADEKQIIEKRYLFGQEWTMVMYNVYHTCEDFPTKQEAYRRKMYRAHERALEEMGRLWDAK